MERISILLELGASSVTLIQRGGEPVGTTLSYLIKCIYDWWDYPLEWSLPIFKLLLSKRPDLNAPSLEMTRRFLKDPDVPISWQSWFCPIAVAVGHMVALGTTEVMDMLLEAGAKLDLPVHASLQPLFTYAMETETYDSPGYEYLCSRGARFEPVWHPQEPVEDHDLLPIFLLCHNWQDELLLNDGRFGVLKLFVERGAVKNVGLRFI